MYQRYISAELTHFTGRGKPEEEKYGTLTKILNSRTLLISGTGGQPGLTSAFEVRFKEAFSENKMIYPGMVCFCDIPTSDLGFHMKKYSEFGLSFQKEFLREKGANPVFYVDRGGGSAKNSEKPKHKVYDHLPVDFHTLIKSMEEVINQVDPPTPRYRRRANGWVSTYQRKSVNSCSLREVWKNTFGDSSNFLMRTCLTTIRTISTWNANGGYWGM